MPWPPVMKFGVTTPPAVVRSTVVPSNSLQYTSARAWLASAQQPITADMRAAKRVNFLELDKALDDTASPPLDDEDWFRPLSAVSVAGLRSSRNVRCGVEDHTRPEGSSDR